MKKITSLMCLALFAVIFIAGCDKKTEAPADVDVKTPPVPAVPEVPAPK